MYYGKQINSNNNSFSLISSSLPLTYSDMLIKISLEEYDVLMKEVELKQKQEKREILEKLIISRKGQIRPDIIEPNQIFQIDEEDEEDSL